MSSRFPKWDENPKPENKKTMKTKTIVIALSSAILASLFLSSCRTTAGNIALGAAAGAALKEAHDEKEREEAREDYYWKKQNQKKKRER